MDRALCAPRRRAAGGFLRGGTGHDAAHGRLLPSHHHFALPVNLLILPLLAVLMPAALLTLLLAGCVARRRCGSGDGGRAGAAYRRGAGASVRLAGLGRFPHSHSAALAIGCLLRAAGRSRLCWRTLSVATRRRDWLRRACLGRAAAGRAGRGGAAAHRAARQVRC